MAITKGQGNPKWTREETALALELYFDSNLRMPSKFEQRVIDLSGYLRSTKIHHEAERNASFRNPDGVAFKVGNLIAVATGKGLTNTSKMDQLVWQEFGSNPISLKLFCEQIRTGIEIIKMDSVNDRLVQDDFEFSEGKVLTRVHRTRERNRALRTKLIKKLHTEDACHCNMCGVKPLIHLGDFGLKMFECHHVIPVSDSLRGKTKLSDLSLLCANCHRLIHGAISLEKRWLTIDSAREILGIINSNAIE